MSQPRILVVDSNARRSQVVRDAISSTMLPNLIHREDGESAVLWVGANECHLCVISYELPGIDGLETLARMRNRRPNLPAIMIAESQEQHVAVAAFRTGVVDFIPATGAFPRILAERAQATLEPDTTSQQTMVQAAEDPTLRDIPRDRLLLTYQNRLRTIGRQLDIYKFNSINIVEVVGGFLVRAFQQRSRRPQAMEFPDRDFPRLVSSAIEAEGSTDEKPVSASDLAPTGYEDMLRALGYELDEISAETIVITELQNVLVVGGRGNDETGAVPGLVPFEKFLKLSDIEYMLNEAFHRRGTYRPPIQQSAQQTGGLRGILKRLN